MVMVVVMMLIIMLYEYIMKFWCHENSEVLEECCVLGCDTAHCDI